MRVQWTYRDVSALLQGLRNFLLGRKHTLHPRFPGTVAPRSIPAPDIPRGPLNRYAEIYYEDRSPYQSIYPPAVAPIAMGTKDGRLKPECIKLPRYPSPGSAWWWDGHCYYECSETPPNMPDLRRPCPPMAAPPPPPGHNPCDAPPCPPCPMSPDKQRTH